MQGPVGVDIDRQHHGDHEVVVVRLTGELDISVAETTGEQIAQAVPTSARGLVVDMSSLDFLDSSGVSMMFGLVRRIGNRRQELRVVAPEGRPPARVLGIVEFDRAAPVHEDLAAAVNEIATPRGRRPPPG